MSGLEGVLYVYTLLERNGKQWMRKRGRECKVTGLAFDQLVLCGG
jgi:hypothetical protein